MDLGEVMKKFETSKKSFSKYCENMEWAVKNSRILRRDYMEQYVAIEDKKVVANDSDLRKLHSKIGFGYGRPVSSSVYIEYVRTEISCWQL